MDQKNESAANEGNLNQQTANSSNKVTEVMEIYKTNRVSLHAINEKFVNQDITGSWLVQKVSARMLDEKNTIIQSSTL